MTTPIPPDFRAELEHAARELELAENALLCSSFHSSASRAKAAAHRARAALEAQPEPVGPTDEQINQCYAALYGLNTDKLGLMPVRFGRELLARWGRSAIEPIPVIDRLPGPEDCAPWPDEPDATPWAWAAKEVAGGWEWAQISMSGIGTETFKRIIAGGGWTHWAPHWAFPTPRSEENLNAT